VTQARPLAVVLPVFLVTRAAIFFAATSATDSIVYHQYGVAARKASVAALFRQHDAEYPQLAVAFSAAVGWVADQLPDGAERAISRRRSKPPDLGTARFQVALGLVLFALDLAALLLIASLTRRDDPRARTWRLGLYIAVTAALGPILYDRLDLVVGVIAFLAVAAAARGWPVAGYALLTAGAAFKVVPVLLLPVLVIAAAARAHHFWPALVKHAAIAGAILAAWPLLAYSFGGGDRSFIYLKYHSARGLELGSAYSAPVLLAAGGEIRYEFGGYAVRGDVADAVARASPILAALALIVAVVVAGRALRRVDDTQRLPVLAVSCSLVWLVFILTGKVGSPQYLLWLAPLVPLGFLRTNWDYRAAALFVVACLLTTLTYPYLWVNVHGPAIPGETGVWAGPNSLGYALLVGRWGALAAYALWLCVRLESIAPTNPHA
jgi:hypothetical protein